MKAILINKHGAVAIDELEKHDSREIRCLEPRFTNSGEVAIKEIVYVLVKENDKVQIFVEEEGL